MRRSQLAALHGLVVMLVLGAVRVACATELDGVWTGYATHGSDTTAFGLTFTALPDGRRLAKLWMPELNSHGSPLGFATDEAGKRSVKEAGMPFELRGDSLVGSFYDPSLHFVVRRGGELPTEPALPTVPAGPAPRWTYRARAAFWATPVVADGLAFVGDAGGTLHAVDLKKGTARWTFEAGAPLFGTATVAGDALYVVADDGTLIKLDRAHGRVAWRVPIGGATPVRSLPSNESAEWDYHSPAPLVDHGVVYVGSADSVFRAIDASNGRERWRFKTAGRLRTGARTDGTRVYFGGLDHFVYALDRKSGTEAWRFDTGSPVTSAPELANGTVVIGTRDRATLYALDAATGKPRWDVYFWLSWVESGARLAGDRLYIGASDSRRVRAIDPTNGKVAWAAQVWGWTWGTPLVVGDTVYYATAGAEKYFIPQQASLGALDRRTGAVLWRRPIALATDRFLSGYASSLAYGGDSVLAAGLDGTLIAFR